MNSITQTPAQFYRRQQKDKKGREIRAIGNPEKATPFELCSDLFIEPASSITKWITSSCNVLIVPLFGAVEFYAPGVNEFIHINQVASFYIKAGSKLKFKNVYPEHTVRFLIIALKSPNATAKRTLDYNLDVPNTLQEVYRDSDTKLLLNLANYEGRQEDIYQLRNPSNSLFAYVLQGAFEFENRLLETGEGLCLWDLKQAELEALAQDSYLLLIEF